MNAEMYYYIALLKPFYSRNESISILGLNFDLIWQAHLNLLIEMGDANCESRQLPIGLSLYTEAKLDPFC